MRITCHFLVPHLAHTMNLPLLLYLEFLRIPFPKENRILLQQTENTQMKLMNFLSIQFSYLLKFRIILYLIYFVAFLAYAGTKFHTIFIFLVNFYNHVKILWFTSWQKSEKLYLDTKTPFLRPGHTLVQSKLKSLSLTLEINSSSARKSSTYDTGITPRMLQNCHLLINCDIIGIL